MSRGHTTIGRRPALCRATLVARSWPYETAVTFAPDFAEAHSNLGNLYLQGGRRDDALRAYVTAIRAKPDLAPVYCNLANVLIDLGRCNEAIAASNTAVRLAPDLYEAHVNLCRAYRRGGRDREALAPALRATELRPDRDTYVNLGHVARDLGAFDIAFDAYRRALELDATCATRIATSGCFIIRPATMPKQSPLPKRRSPCRQTSPGRTSTWRTHS